MAKIRMTENDFKGLIRDSIIRSLNESINQNELLSKIVQAISEMDGIDAKNGDNELEVVLNEENELLAFVMYTINDQRYLVDNGGDGYITPREYDAEGEFYVDIEKIEVYLEGEFVGAFNDENNMVSDVLKDHIMLEDYDLPYEKEYFDEYDEYDR